MFIRPKIAQAILMLGHILAKGTVGIVQRDDESGEHGGVDVGFLGAFRFIFGDPWHGSNDPTSL